MLLPQGLIFLIRVENKRAGAYYDFSWNRDRTHHRNYIMGLVHEATGEDCIERSCFG